MIEIWKDIIGGNMKNVINLIIENKNIIGYLIENKQVIFEDEGWLIFNYSDLDLIDVRMVKK